jgi:hypothetical protein
MCMGGSTPSYPTPPPPVIKAETPPPFPVQAPAKTAEEHRARYKGQREDNTPAFQDPYTSLLNPMRMEERPTDYKPITLMQDWERRKKEWDAGGWKLRTRSFGGGQNSGMGGMSGSGGSGLGGGGIGPGGSDADSGNGSSGVGLA